MIVSLLIVIVSLLGLQCWMTYQSMRTKSAPTKTIKGGVLYDNAGRRDAITEDDE